MNPRYFAAVDLGASSGRVILGKLVDQTFELEEMVRFPNRVITAEDGSLRTDVSGLFAQVRVGIASAIEASRGKLESVGVDTWGVDYALLDHDGELVSNPHHYRDSRTVGIPQRVFERLSAGELYARAGLQVMEFNTLFQLVAASEQDWTRVDRLVMLPDLFSYWLGGQITGELSAASTTGLLDVRARTWSDQTCAQLASQYGLPLPNILPELVEPGTLIGETPSGMFKQQLKVIAVAGHDTASAVVAIPATGPDFAYISSGTWSLVGLELDQPVLDETSQHLDFTNELGIDSTVRYLRNVAGLWTLNESLRTWRDKGRTVSLKQLLGRSASLPGLGCVIDLTDPRLLAPGDMPTRLAELAKETGQQLGDDPAQVCRCILDSLALSYRRIIRQAARLAEREVRVIHIVGGGSQNALLCQLSAESTGLDVVAGPAEGTALGNLLIQARTCGALTGDRTTLRQVAARSCHPTTYHPGAMAISDHEWAQAEELVFGQAQ